MPYFQPPCPRGFRMAPGNATLGHNSGVFSDGHGLVILGTSDLKLARVHSKNPSRKVAKTQRKPLRLA